MYIGCKLQIISTMYPVRLTDTVRPVQKKISLVRVYKLIFTQLAYY